MFDVIVIGAGPAGATFARLANKNLKIAIVEKNTNREKCCGGLIAPDAQKIFAGFDMSIPKDIIADPQLFYVRSIDLNTGREGKYQRHYTNVNRKALDNYLVSLLPNNVELFMGYQYISHIEKDGFIFVILKKGEQLFEYKCKFLVGADGAKSRVRKNLFNDFKNVRKYLTIQGEYEKIESINHFAVFFDETLSDFYSWLIPKDNMILIGGAFSDDSKPRKKYDKLVSNVQKCGYMFGKEKSINSCYIIRPRLKDIMLGNKNIILIGEAAGFISPSSSEGLSYAYRSASDLAMVIEKDRDNVIKGYARKVTKIKANIMIKNIKSLFLYNSALRNLIFSLKIGTINNP